MRRGRRRAIKDALAEWLGATKVSWQA